jgi:hypothetical protein
LITGQAVTSANPYDVKSGSVVDNMLIEDINGIT